MGKEENSFHGNVCAYLTCRLMGDTVDDSLARDRRALSRSKSKTKDVR